jgi:hypothetical protein
MVGEVEDCGGGAAFFGGVGGGLGGLFEAIEGGFAEGEGAEFVGGFGEGLEGGEVGADGGGEGGEFVGGEVLAVSERAEVEAAGDEGGQ